MIFTKTETPSRDALSCDQCEYADQIIASAIEAGSTASPSPSAPYASEHDLATNRPKETVNGATTTTVSTTPPTRSAAPSPIACWTFSRVSSWCWRPRPTVMGTGHAGCTPRMQCRSVDLSVQDGLGSVHQDRRNEKLVTALIDCYRDCEDRTEADDGQ